MVAHETNRPCIYVRPPIATGCRTVSILKSQILEPGAPEFGRGFSSWRPQRRFRRAGRVSLPMLPVERPALHRLGDVFGLNLLAPAQVGDGARYPQDLSAARLRLEAEQGFCGPRIPDSRRMMDSYSAGVRCSASAGGQKWSK